jgi:hypothetical protein
MDAIVLTIADQYLFIVTSRFGSDCFLVASAATVAADTGAAL